MPKLLRLRESTSASSAEEGQQPTLHVAPADRLESLVAQIAQAAVIAIEFPGPGDGRGYTHARLLRERYRFKGELRAVGHIKQDQLFFMARVGFDAFELADGEDVQVARQALQRYSVAYQTLPHARVSTAHRT